jgi:integrator complex subunit 8
MNLRDNGLITYAKHSLQTCDPVVIKNCISKYNLSVNQSQNPLPTLATLRYFWPQWDKAASKILSPKDGQQLINASTLGQLIKTSSPNDMDFFFICYAKVIQLCDVKKFECATKLLRLINVKLNSKIITNLMLYLSIHKYLSQDFDFNNNNNTNNTTNQETLVKMCKTFLLDSKKDPDMSLEIFVSVVGFLLTSGEYALLLSNEVNFIVAPLHQSNFHQQQKRQNLNLNQQSPIAVFFFTLGKNLAKLCLELVQSDKSNIRKTARDLWDMFVELFSDPTIQQQQQQQQQLKAQKRSHLDAGLESDSPAAAATAFANRKLLRTFLRSAKSQLVKNILISLFSTLYNIGDAAASNEIFSEFRHLWPSSLASAGSLNINAINDLLTVLIQSDSLQNANELNCQWLRTQADLFVTRANYCDAFRLFIELIVYETKYFFKYRSASSPKEHVSNEDRFIDEKTIKSMIKTAGLLNKHTHAAILCQFLTKNQDYSTAFRFLQDGTMITLTGDEMDLLYKCVWDMTLLEYLTNLNSIRGFISKRNVCLKLCTNPNMNPSIFEIFQKTVESKKKNFFKQLISYYFLYD